jgi:hypothetical protein
VGADGRRKTENGERQTEDGRGGAESEVSDGAGAENSGGGAWRYVGVGCLTLVGGFFGGGMVAVFVAKIVGVAQHCAADVESGAPCDWFRFWVVGAVAGGILLPAVAITKLRRGAASAGNPE